MLIHVCDVRGPMVDPDTPVGQSVGPGSEEQPADRLAVRLCTRRASPRCSAAGREGSPRHHFEYCRPCRSAAVGRTYSRAARVKLPRATAFSRFIRQQLGFLIVVPRTIPFHQALLVFALGDVLPALVSHPHPRSSHPVRSVGPRTASHSVRVSARVCGSSACCDSKADSAPSIAGRRPG